MAETTQLTRHIESYVDSSSTPAQQVHSFLPTSNSFLFLSYFNNLRGCFSITGFKFERSCISREHWCLTSRSTGTFHFAFSLRHLPFQTTKIRLEIFMYSCLPNLCICLVCFASPVSKSRSESWRCIWPQQITLYGQEVRFLFF